MVVDKMSSQREIASSQRLYKPELLCYLQVNVSIYLFIYIRNKNFYWLMAVEIFWKWLLRIIGTFHKTACKWTVAQGVWFFSTYRKILPSLTGRIYGKLSLFFFTFADSELVRIEYD